MGALDDGEKVMAPDAATWRAWLEENHTTSTGAWLIRARPGSSVSRTSSASCAWSATTSRPVSRALARESCRQRSTEIAETWSMTPE